MNTVAAIDRQLDERARSAHDESTVDNSIENAPRGAQIVLTNHLSTPVLVAIFAAFGCLGLAIAVVALYTGLAVGAGNEASSFGHQAEREARVAQDQVNSLNNRLNEQVSDLTVRVEVAEALINRYGLKESK